MPDSCAAQPLSFTQVAKATYKEWSGDNASRLAAAFSYYAIFSIGPLLLIFIMILGLFFGEKAASDQIRPQLSQLIGENGAQFAQDLVAKAAYSPSLSLAGILSFLLLLYAATNLFAALQNALNTIFDVEPKPGRGIMDTLKERGVTFLMVLGIGAFVLTTIVLNTLLTNFTTWGAARFFPNHPDLAAFMLQAVSFLVSVFIYTGVFAIIFKYLPDIKIDWKDTLIGAAVTAALFSLARIGLSYYLSRSSTAGPFGAAGSLVIIMLFIYYSSQIMFLGAEFTQVWACRSGKPILPADNAVRLNKKTGAADAIAATPAAKKAAAKSRHHWWAERKPLTQPPLRAAGEWTMPANKPPRGRGGRVKESNP